MNTTQSPQHVEGVIVCPQCDALYQLRRPNPGEEAVCQRCHASLIAPRRRAGLHIIAISLAIVILILAAAFAPFLTIRAAGSTNSVSIMQAAFVFSDGPLLVLALATAALIIFIPLTRVLMTLYVLVPLVLDARPPKGAKRAFRVSEALRPWSMAEIFAIGCAVALVKITDLADVSFGPAFWMFAGLVILVVFQDRFMCRWSVWDALDIHSK